MMARQAAKDASGFVEPPFLHDEGELDEELPIGPGGQRVSRTGYIRNSNPRSGNDNPEQTVGLNFKSDQYGNSVPPDVQGAIGPTQFLSVGNRGLITFGKTTGTADGALNVTLNTFFSSVNAGQSTFDPIARYDRISQRWIVTAEDGLTPNHIFIAVSNTSTITSVSAWTFYSFDISLVTPAGNSTCFADYPTTAVDANALIIGTNNFCPSTYANSAVYVVRKSAILSGGPIVVTAFRNVGQVTPRGVDSWDPDPSGTAPSYFISAITTTSLRLRRISDPAGTPTLSGGLDVTIPTIASPIALEHSGNNHPGGSFNGKVDASDTRFMPMLKRGDVLWAAHGCGVNSSGVASAADRDAVRWYQISNLSTTPTLTQSGTIFDAAATNPKSYTYGTVAVTGQGHAVFGFSVISAATFNSGGYTARLVNDAAGSTQTPQVYVNGVGSYNAFDLGTSRAQRWGDYSQTMVDPSDDMTVWTAQEFTAVANTAGSSNAQWGIQVAQLKAPPPATPSLATPSEIPLGRPSVNVTITGTVVSGSGFFEPGTGFSNHVSASVTGGVTVNSVTYVDPTHVTLNISTVGATTGSKNVTITNPDGQSATGTGLFDSPLPIQLASFSGRFINATDVRLDWMTMSEINNYGFEVQKQADQTGEFHSIVGSFVPGHGTTNEPHSYSYTDAPVQTPLPNYRLKQMDLDGSTNYSDPISLQLATGVESKTVPAEFSLAQNYPNPFNPSTAIVYGLPVASDVKLTVFNTLGQRVASLVNERQEAGFHTAVFDNESLSSGVYYYTIDAGQFRASKKLLLLR
ncbi:MAG TPA: hypothetical protein DGH68_07185 [Bacteroidetes bacterium]|nr:hypothetical protein [Bacteroidota bacterium]